MKSLPSNVTAYKRTDVFTETSVPKGLLNTHRTLPGVWGKIVVLEGSLTYVIVGAPEEYELNAERFGVVEPQVVHHVRPNGKVSFYVEFYK
ncbi:MAG TPA: DUF1971 domain-containing protein [Bacteriovoracaceae bacterium]|nr:DUF1971 domain-containing protein [Bacteriovoracaceae bacterium]